MHVFIIASRARSLINFRGPMICAMIAAGHTVSVAAPNVDTEIRSRLNRWGVSVFQTDLQRTGTGIRADLAYLNTLTSLMREIQPDLVLTYTIKPNIWGAFAASKVKVRSAAMVTGLGYAFTEGGTKATLKRRAIQAIARFLYKASVKRNWRVIFQNPDDRDDFITARCLSDLNKIRMVNGSGVDLDHFRPAALPEQPEFLMASRILEAKGVREYANAAALVKMTHPEAKFRLVGFFDEGPDGISKSEMAEWVANGLDYIGETDDVRPFLKKCRIYVLPSYREGTPRSVLEAMATGRPILTSDAPGCRETVEDGVNGFLVPVRDSKALAEKMRWLIDSTDSCAAMAEESLRIARGKYDVHKVNTVLLNHLGLDK